MSNFYSLPTARFKTVALKNEALSDLMNKLDATLTLKQFSKIRQTGRTYKALALRTLQVSKSKLSHEIANEIIRLSDIPVMSIEEREKGESTAI